MTLQQAVFAGLVDPGNLVIVRKIVNKETLPADCAATAPKNCDAATFAGPLSQYTITNNANGSVTVADNNSTSPATAAAPATGDGFDTLFNVEQLKFSDQTVTVAAPAAPAITSVTAGNARATVNFTATANPNLTGFDLIATPVAPSANPVVTRSGLAVTARTGTITGLVNGQAYTIQVRANGTTGSSLSVASASVTPTAPTATAPTAAPVIGTAVRGNTQATVSWSAVAAAGNGGSPITGYSVQVITGGNVIRTVTPGNVTATVVAGLLNGTSYTFRVAAVNAIGTGPLSAASNAVVPATAATAPSIPTNVVATRGNAQVSLSWAVNNGGSAITSSNVQVRNNATGALVQNITITGTATTRVVTGLANGTTYNFRVRATNAVGTSALSPAVTATPATTPGAPGINPPAAVAGVAGGAITATANWTAPAATGGTPITSYTVRALRLSAAGAVLSTTTVTGVLPNLRTRAVTLPVAGNYRFTVQAVNAVGGGAQSARSNLVAGR